MKPEIMEKELRKRHSHSYDFYTLLTISGVVFMVYLMLCAPEIAAEGGSTGLMLCAHAVIPSLFPFLVLSPMLAAGIGFVIAQLCRGRLGLRHTSLISARRSGNRLYFFHIEEIWFINR